LADSLPDGVSENFDYRETNRRYVDTSISRIKHAAILLAVRTFENPLILLILFFAIFYPLVLITLDFTRSPTPLIFELVVVVLALFLLWVILNALSTSWEGVIVSAERIKDTRFQKEAVKTHFEITLRFLRFALEELEVDVLAVRSKHGLGTGSEESKRYSARIAVQALTLKLFEDLIYLPAVDRDKVLDLYNADLRHTFEVMPTPEGATVDFVARHFDQLDDRLRKRAKSWRPPQSFLEAIEKHPATVALIVALSVLGIAVLAAAVFKVTIPISP
jgi:hypothetical protein